MNADKIFIDEATDISALLGYNKHRIILIGVCHATSLFEKNMLMERLCDGVLIHEPELPVQRALFSADQVIECVIKIKDEQKDNHRNFEQQLEDLKQQCNMPMEDIRILTFMDFATEAVDDLSLALLSKASLPPVQKKVHAYYRSPVIRPPFVRRGHRQSYKPDG